MYLPGLVIRGKFKANNNTEINTKRTGFPLLAMFAVDSSLNSSDLLPLSLYVYTKHKIK